MSKQGPEAEDLTQYGGQAVVEGVMMRSRRYFAVACRRLSSGTIVTLVEPIPERLTQLRWLNAPFLRGSLALADAFSLGYRTLIYAANLQISDIGSVSDEALVQRAFAAADSESGQKPKESAGTKAITGITIGVTSVLALVFGYALFWILPAALTDLAVATHIKNSMHASPGMLLPHPREYSFGANLAEGGLRIGFFLLYLTAVSRLKNVQRVFEYHGAEHKAINTLESGQPLDVDHAMKASRIHPRCGTNFIFIVLITSIFVFSLIPRYIPLHGVMLYAGVHLMRLALLPVVAGISYEVLRFAGSHRDKPWAQLLIAPGLWTQNITTREPDESQIEVALTALKAVMDRESEKAPPQDSDVVAEEEAAAEFA